MIRILAYGHTTPDGREVLDTTPAISIALGLIEAAWWITRHEPAPAPYIREWRAVTPEEQAVILKWAKDQGVAGFTRQDGDDFIIVLERVLQAGPEVAEW